MSYSVSDHVDHVDGCLVFAKALYETYPDARYEGGRWYSDAVLVSECEVVDLVVVPSKSPDGRAELYIRCGKKVAGGVVWSDEKRFGRMLPTYFSADLSKGEDDDLRQALLEWAGK